MFRRRSVTITAGEPQQGAWCPVCLMHTRLRVPLRSATGSPLGTLEICPGCGTGHDRYSASITPPSRRRWRLPRHPLAGTARAVHGWRCARHGTQALECAYGDCPWPGLPRHTTAVEGDGGTWRYVFCRRTHRRAWAQENGIALPGGGEPSWR